MNELFEVALAFVLVLAAGTPFIIAFSKARKEMREDGNDDVLD